MSSFLALIACTIFVLFLLRLERKQASEVSRAMWIPTVWLLLTIGKSLGAWFKMEGGSLESGSPMDRNFLIVLFCLSLIVLSKRHFNWRAVIQRNYWVMVLVSFMLVSILWSSMPSVSFKRFVRELVALTMAFLISSEKNPSLAIKSVIRRAIYILLPFSLLLIKYYPELGREYSQWGGEMMWIGVTTQKNQLALLCVISAFFIIWLLWQRWKGHDLPVTKYQIYIEFALLFLSLYLLGGPQRSLYYSATSFVSFALGLMAFVGLLWVKKKKWRFRAGALYVLFAFIFIYGTITPFIGRLSFWDVSSFVGRNESFTGRTSIWATLLPYAISRPILGHGVGGFWTTKMRELTSSNAHNGYLDVILHYGFFGLGLVILFILNCSKKAITTLRDNVDWGILFICCIFMSLVHNIMESSIYTFTTALTALILMLSVTTSEEIASQSSNS